MLSQEWEWKETSPEMFIHYCTLSIDEYKSSFNRAFFLKWKTNSHTLIINEWRKTSVSKWLNYFTFVTIAFSGWCVLTWRCLLMRTFPLTTLYGDPSCSVNVFLWHSISSFTCMANTSQIFFLHWVKGLLLKMLCNMD